CFVFVLALSLSSTAFYSFLDHSNANQQDERAERDMNHNSQHDPISSPPTPPSSSAKRQKTLPNQSHRQSKPGEQFPHHVPLTPSDNSPAESRKEAQPQQQQVGGAKPKNPGNQPSSMDDIIGGLLTLMGGNMKLPGGGAQQGPPQANG